MSEFELRSTLSRSGNANGLESLDNYIALRDTLNIELQSALDNVYGLHRRVKEQELEQSSRLRAIANAQRREAVNKQRLTVTVFVLIAVVLLTGGGAAYYIRSQRLQSERELLAAKAEQDRLERANIQLQLDAREKDLQSAAEYFSLQERLTDSFLGKLEKLRALETPTQQCEELQSIMLELKALKPTEEKTQELATQLNAANTEFYDQLRERYSGLSEKDIELCGLIRLGLEAKEQALMRGISEVGIRKARYRLAKRLKLEDGSELDSFLREL